jgi:O-antigen biosynthesis protein WbqV
LATAFAVIASFYLRFEGKVRRPPAFAAARPAVLRPFQHCRLLRFQATTTKWRFISLPDFINIAKVSTVLALMLLVLDYIFIAPSTARSFSARPRSLSMVLAELRIECVARRYRYFRYTRTLSQARSLDASPTLLVGRAADGSAVARH